MKNLLLVGTLLLGIGPAGAMDAGHSLAVEVSGGAPGVGQILGSLFNSEESYMVAPVAEATAEVDGNGNARLSFDGLPPGEYALSIVYDEDSDGVLDTGFLGIPRESFGFSNNAEAHFGPPPFEDAKFVLPAGGTRIEIDLRAAN
jgi:uncharacterized protein (DUF2141 family)